MPYDWSPINIISVTDTTSDSSFDSHQIARYQIDRIDLEGIFSTLGGHSFSMAEGRDLRDSNEETYWSQRAAPNPVAGGPTVGGVSSGGISKLPPQQSGIVEKLGYGTFTPQRVGSEVYLGSKPGSARGNNQYQSLHYGYGTNWVQEATSGVSARSRHLRAAPTRRRLLTNLEPLMEGSDSTREEPAASALPLRQGEFDLQMDRTRYPVFSKSKVSTSTPRIEGRDNSNYNFASYHKLTFVFNTNCTVNIFCIFSNEA